MAKQNGDAAPPPANADLEPFIARIEEMQAEIDANNLDNRTRNAPHREIQAEVRKEAADAGFPRDYTNRLIRERRLKRQVAAIEDGLAEERIEEFRALQASLEKSLPLFPAGA